MAKEKNIKDKDANMAARLFNLFCYLFMFALISAFIINAYHIVDTGIALSKNNTDKIIENVNFLRDDFIFENEITIDVTEKNATSVAKDVIFGLAVYEVLFVIMFIMYFTISKFLSNKNLINPFTDDAIKLASRVVKIIVVAIVIACIADIVASFVITNSDIMFDFLGSVNYEIALIFALVRYILVTGKNKIEQK